MSINLSSKRFYSSSLRVQLKHFIYQIYCSDWSFSQVRLQKSYSRALYRKFLTLLAKPFFKYSSQNTIYLTEHSDWTILYYWWEILRPVLALTFALFSLHISKKYSYYFEQLIIFVIRVFLMCFFICFCFALELNYFVFSIWIVILTLFLLYC